MIDTPLKAVGVGSVGTSCAIGLMRGPHPEDWLLSQSKQALPSCVSQQLGVQAWHEGQWVVEVQRRGLHVAMGEGKTFDWSIASFSVTFSDQVEEDRRALLQAMASGRLTSSD